VYDGILDAIEALRSAGLTIAVFTGATRSAAELQLAHAGIAQHIQALVGSDEIERVKPAPDGILLACHRLRVDASGAAYVGDALSDLRCARAAGSLPVAAGWGHLHEPDADYHLLANEPRELTTLLCS
jgi:HAD superfamily hydrolase (TIGR01549 family)